MGKTGQGNVLDLGTVALSHLEHADRDGRLAQDPEQASFAGGEIGDLLNLYREIAVRQGGRLALLPFQGQVEHPGPSRSCQHSGTGPCRAGPRSRAGFKKSSTSSGRLT